MLSSSPVTNTGEMVGRAFDAGFGGAVFKTIPVTGQGIKIVHPSPRMAPLHYQNKRLVGLQNVEQISDRPMEYNMKDMAWLKKNWPEKIVISSIMGFSNEEWGELAKRSEDVGADMLELNFSCPHMTVEGSGMEVGRAFQLLEQYTETVKKNCSIPVLAKMTPNITDICEPAIYAKKGGADGIAAINTVSGIAGIDINTHIPSPNVFGKGAASGYSGPAVKPIGLRCVSQLAQHPDLGLPISGIGGIETWMDVVEYMLCGSGTIQITTGVIHYGYRIVEDILEGLSYYMEEQGIDSLESIVGKSLDRVVHTDAFDLDRQGSAFYDLDRCIGCGQCHVVCQDAGGQCLSWDNANRRPVMDESKCVGCMICSFICPVSSPPMITYKEVPGKPEVIPLPSE